MDTKLVETEMDTLDEKLWPYIMWAFQNNDEIG